MITKGHFPCFGITSVLPWPVSRNFRKSATAKHHYVERGYLFNTYMEIMTPVRTESKATRHLRSFLTSVTLK